MLLSQCSDWAQGPHIVSRCSTTNLHPNPALTLGCTKIQTHVWLGSKPGAHLWMGVKGCLYMLWGPERTKVYSGTRGGKANIGLSPLVLSSSQTRNQSSFFSSAPWKRVDYQLQVHLGHDFGCRYHDRKWGIMTHECSSLDLRRKKPCRWHEVVTPKLGFCGVRMSLAPSTKSSRIISQKCNPS